MKSLNKKQKSVVKSIRRNFSQTLKFQIRNLLAEESSRLTRELDKLNFNIPSYLENGESRMGYDDIKGFVIHELILELKKLDPSGDFDGYNRWEKFEEIEGI